MARRNEELPTPLMLVCGAVLLIVILALTSGWEAWSCHARWKDSGMESRWGPIIGCQCQTTDGSWIPEDRVREVRP